MADAIWGTQGLAGAFDNVQDDYEGIAEQVKTGGFANNFEGMFDYQKADMEASIGNAKASNATRSIITALKENTR